MFRDLTICSYIKDMLFAFSQEKKVYLNVWNNFVFLVGHNDHFRLRNSPRIQLRNGLGASKAITELLKANTQKW